MSRIGKLPIPLEKGVKAQLAGDLLKVEGPKGKLEMKIPNGFAIEMKDSRIEVKRPGDSQRERALHGLVRKLIANRSRGAGTQMDVVAANLGAVTDAEVRGSNIHLSLGYS